VVEASYEGPKFEKSVDEIDSEWCKKVMQWQKDGKVLHKKFAVMIIQRAIELFKKNKSLVDIVREDEEEITVCGDIHG
jgi:serine/threonine-protein phosphatase 5